MLASRNSQFHNVNMLPMGNLWNASCMLYFCVFLDNFQFNASTTIDLTLDLVG